MHLFTSILSRIGKRKIQTEEQLCLFTCVSFYIVDLTNFTVTRDSQLRWCIENQRVWMALRGAGFQAHANPSQDCTDTEHVIQNGHDDGPYSTIFPCVSQAVRWLLGGRDPLVPPFSPDDLPLPDFLSQASRLQILIGGSLHLVGTAMKVLGPEIVGDV